MFKHITTWKLIRRKGTGPYILRFTTVAGKTGERKTSETTKRKADKVIVGLLKKADEDIEAAQHEEERELNGWDEFCARYIDEKLAFGPYKTLQAFETARNRLNELCPGLEWVTDLDERVFSLFALRLRQEGKSISTVHAYRNHLMGALKWARQVRLIDSRPDPPPIGKIDDPARGRPITREEAERIAMQLPSVVTEEYADRWAWNLEALWRSGFRLGETFKFFWEPTHAGHYVVDLESNRPMIQIVARAEKARQNRLIPMTPDFASLLRSVKKSKRRDLVFRWTLSKGDSMSIKTVGKYISRCGRQANVVVSDRDGKKRFASSHEFRRSFGARWSPKVMPDTLRVMMRHASISTTLEYYVQANATKHADALYEAVGDMADVQTPVLSSKT
jgi:integrase